MSSDVSLLRRFFRALHPSCSRIPHIRAHILGRRAQTPSPRAPRCALTQPLKPPKRNVSTATPPQPIPSRPTVYWEPDVRQPEREQFREDADYQSADRHRKLAQLDPHTLLAQGHPDGVLYALLLQKDDSSLAQELDEEAFERAFCTLDPDHLLGHFIRIYRTLPHVLHLSPLFHHVRPMEERFDSFYRILDELIARRSRQAGKRLTLSVCQHLMLFAETMGDADLAEHVFRRLMPEHRVTPNLQCYNSYMAAQAFSGTHEVAQRHLDRRVQYNMRIRENPEVQGRMEHRRDHSALNRGRPERPPPASIRKSCLQLFKEMTEQGLSGDEHTFTTLLHAMGQAGDLEGAKSILRSVWNINVDLLAQYDEEEIESPTYYEADSPLRPTERLLFAVILVFGNNNDMHTASSLLDYVSRLYNLPVPEKVWMRLYELTFVFNSYTGSKKFWAERHNRFPGQLGRDALDELYAVITDEPYNIRPNVAMLTWRARIKSNEKQIGECVTLIDTARSLANHRRGRLSKLYDDMLDQISAITQQRDWNVFFSTDFLQARREFITESIKSDRDSMLIGRPVNRLLTSQWEPGTIGFSLNASRWFPHRTLPILVEKYQTLLPKRLSYHTETGLVEILNSNVHREYALRNANDHFRVRAGVLRRALDVEDPGVLLHNLERLPGAMRAQFEEWCFVCRCDTHKTHQCPLQEIVLAGYQVAANGRLLAWHEMDDTGGV